MSAALLSTSSAAALAARPSAAAVRARRSVVVRAAAADRQGAGVTRRAAASLLALPLIFPGASRALIPDDDDEELVEKAKANRKARLAQDKKDDKAFIKSEGITTAKEVNDLVPVQKAIAELAKAGSQLESGDVGAVAGTVGGAWVKEFKSAALELSASDAAKASADAVFSQIATLEKAAKAKKTAEAKSSFVALVDSVQSWTADAGVADKLKGL